MCHFSPFMCKRPPKDVGEHYDKLQAPSPNVNLPLFFANVKYSLQKCKYAACESKMRSKHERTTSIRRMSTGDPNKMELWQVSQPILGLRLETFPKQSISVINCLSLPRHLQQHYKKQIFFHIEQSI